MGRPQKLETNPPRRRTRRPWPRRPWPRRQPCQMQRQLQKREQEWKLERKDLEAGKNSLTKKCEEETSKYKEAMNKVDQYLAELELANQKINRLSLEQSSTNTQMSGVEQNLKNQIK